MKKTLLLAIIGLNLLLVGSVWADQISEQNKSLQKQLIKIKCSSIKIQIDKVKKNDKLNRVNYGQSYESILNNLMTPVNTRLVANRYGEKTDILVKKSHQFEQEVIRFRELYKQYDTHINQLSNTSCQKNAEKFLDKLVKTQAKRKQLKKQTQVLEKLFNQYRQSFEEVTNEK